MCFLIEYFQYTEFKILSQEYKKIMILVLLLNKKVNGFFKGSLLHFGVHLNNPQFSELEREELQK